MKNKRLLIILIILFFLTVAIVLGSTVFLVSDVSLNWNTPVSEFSLTNDDVILNSADINRKQSVFLISKDEYINKLESNNPFLKVDNIEIVFPAKIIVHVSEREPMFALKVSNHNEIAEDVFVVLDRELKVLSIQNSVPVAETQPIEVRCNGITDSNFVVGEFAEFLQIGNHLTEFGESMSMLSYSADKIKLFAKSIELNDGCTRMIIETRFGSLQLEIRNPSENFLYKLQLGVSKYEKILKEEYTSWGRIIVYSHDEFIYSP